MCVCDMQCRFVWIDGRWLLAVLETTTGCATVSLFLAWLIYTEVVLKMVLNLH